MSTLLKTVFKTCVPHARLSVSVVVGFNHKVQFKLVEKETGLSWNPPGQVRSVTWEQRRYLKRTPPLGLPQCDEVRIQLDLIRQLRDVLECPDREAEQIFVHIPASHKDHPELILERALHFKKHNVPIDALISYPLLWQLSLKTFGERARLLTAIGISTATVPLLRLTTRQLAAVVSKWLSDRENIQREHFHDRLEFFAHHLQCNVPELSMMMHVHYPLLTLEWHRMSRMIRLLLNSGIPPEDIKKDLWIFRHNEEMIGSRLQRCQEAGVTPVKTWMLRCPESIFANSLEKWHNIRDVLGVHEDPVSYLAERLRCSREDIVILSKRYPRLLSINLPKVKLLLDFLFDSGFTPDQVCHAPRVLGHSIATLQHRLQELNHLGYHPKHLRLLFYTAKEYQRFVEKLQRAKRV